MPVSSVEVKSQVAPEADKFPSTGRVHRFKNPIEYIAVKSSELQADMNRILKVLNNPSLVIEEGCNSALCQAPREAHILARAA